jgi:hypothetical protein
MVVLLNKQFGQKKSNDTLFYLYKNCAYLEFLGNAQSLLSINYERILNPSSKGKLHYSLRTGLGFYKRRQDSAWVFNFPFELNFMYGKSKHYIESSVGYTASFGKDLIDSAYSPPEHFRAYNHVYIFRLGYRYMYDGVLVRVTPIFIYNANYINSRINFSGCLSVGIAF